jgi:UDP-glucose-4-epimerase GalE
MTAVLVTGGAGYIGSHTCKELARSGFLPIVYDDLRRGHREAVQWGPLEVGALDDLARLREVITRHRPIAVIHLAAYAYVGESMSDPAKYYANNVHGSLSLFEAMRESGLDVIVYSSSCATYGVPERVPIGEEAPQRPINPYGATKLMVERILHDFGAAYGFRWTALRYFNAAGASPEGDIGESHDPETHLIPRALMAAAGALDSLEIMGDDYPTPDGTAVRDYVHVVDIAHAHVLALRRLLAGGRSCALNLGTGRGCSVFEIVRAVERLTAASVPANVTPRRPGDPPVLVAETQRAAQELGFRPKYVDVVEVVETAWRWYVRRRGPDLPTLVVPSRACSADGAIHRTDSRHGAHHGGRPAVGGTGRTARPDELEVAPARRPRVVIQGGG